MGNSESSETSRPQHGSLHDISNISSASLPNRPVLGSARPSQLSLTKQASWSSADVVVTSPTGENRSRSEARHQLRAELFRASSEELGLIYETDGLHNATGAVGAAEKSTDGREAYPNAPVRRSSGMDIAAAISLLQDLKKNATNDELSALQKVLMQAPESGSIAKQSNPSVTVDPAVAPLIRRRSLLTPGLATRHNDTRLPRKPLSRAQTDLPRHQTWELHMFGKSPLTRLASIDSSSIDINDPIKRALTPCEKDYSQLGAHKLGSLRITNGYASPEPSYIQLARSPKDGRREEEYFTASEGRSSPEGEDDQPINFHSFVDDSHRLTRDMHRSQPQSLLSIPNLEPKRYSVNVPLARTTTVQRRYSELIANPFEDSVDVNLSKSSSDNPFVDEGFDSSMNDAAIINCSKSTDRGLSGTSTGKIVNQGWYNVGGKSFRTGQYALDIPATRSETPSVYAEDSTRDPILASTLHNADSGYSSEASLKARSSNADGELAQSFGAVDHNNIEHEKWAEIERSDDVASTAQSPLSLQKMIASPLPALIAAKSAPQTPTSFRDLGPSLHPDQAFTRPLLGNSSPKFTQTSYSPKTTAQQTPTKSSTPKKLQKRRPLSHIAGPTPITVQRNRSISGIQIPVVPTDIALQHSHRLSRCPEMNHLERTYDSVSTTNAQDHTDQAAPSLLNTPIRFPSPESSAERKNSQERGRKPGHAESQPMQRLVRSLSRKRNQRSSFHEFSVCETTVIGVADLGSTAESIGRSPYDVARRTAFPQQGSSGPVNKTYPHQISNTGLPNKRTIGMDDATASEFAWKRSRDRADFLKHKGALRPRSFHGSELDGIDTVTDPALYRSTHGEGGFRARTNRPKSMHEPADQRHLPQFNEGSCHGVRIRPVNLMLPVRRWETEPDLRYQQSSPPKPFDPNAPHRRQYPPPSATITPSWSYQADLWRQRRQLAVQGFASAGHSPEPAAPQHGTQALATAHLPPSFPPPSAAAAAAIMPLARAPARPTTPPTDPSPRSWHPGRPATPGPRRKRAAAASTPDPPSQPATPEFDTHLPLPPPKETPTSAGNRVHGSSETQQQQQADWTKSTLGLNDMSMFLRRVS